jgi:hypothetical protein
MGHLRVVLIIWQVLVTYIKCENTCLCYFNERTNQRGTWSIDCSRSDHQYFPARLCSQDVNSSTVTSFNFTSSHLTKLPFNYFTYYTRLARLTLAGSFASGFYYLPSTLVSFDISNIYNGNCTLTSLRGIFSSRLAKLDIISWKVDPCLTSVLRHDFSNLSSLSEM